MRTRVRTDTVYEFSELSEASQQKALEQIAQGNHELFDSDQLLDTFKETLTEWGFPTETVEFSLSYSQGDGVAFYGNIALEKYLRKTKQLTKFRERLRRIPFDNVEATIGRNSFGHHYSHYNTMQLDLVLYDATEWQESQAEDWTDIILEDIRTVSRQLEKLGYAELEHVASRDYIIEQIEANEWEFTADGAMI